MQKKVMIIDDDISILEAVSMMLEEEGYNTVSCAKKECVEEISTLQPDLILLDVLLSGLDGREICRSLKQNKTTKNIPVIMISAHPSAEESAMESGAQAFIAKPFEIDNMLNQIKFYTAS